MNYGSGTVGRIASRQLADAACALSRQQHFSAWNDIMAESMSYHKIRL